MGNTDKLKEALSFFNENPYNDSDAHINLLIDSMKSLDFILGDSPTDSNALNTLSSFLSHSSAGWRASYELSQLLNVKKLSTHNIEKYIVEPVLEGMKKSRAWGYGLASILSNGRAYDETIGDDDKLKRKAAPITQVFEGRKEELYRAITEALSLERPTEQGIVPSRITLGDDDLYKLATDLFIILYLGNKNELNNRFKDATKIVQGRIVTKLTSGSVELPDHAKKHLRKVVSRDIRYLEVVLNCNTGLFTLDERENALRHLHEQGSTRYNLGTLPMRSECKRHEFPKRLQKIAKELESKW